VSGQKRPRPAQFIWC